jgi:hypothetical protein
MRKPQWDVATSARHEDLQGRRLDSNDRREGNPPAPLQIFTRLSLLLVIALAFGLAGELLARLPQ